MIRRLSSLLLALVAILAALFVAAPAAADEWEPRKLSAAEREAVALALVYLDAGAGGWWDRLAADAPLRALGREAAVAEIAVRCGPRRGVSWQLRTPAADRGPNVAIFAIEMPSGIDEILELVLAEHDGWKIREIRSLVDPAPPRAPTVTTGASAGEETEPSAVLALAVLALAALAIPWRRRPWLRLGAAMGLSVVLACQTSPGDGDATAADGAAVASSVLRLASLAPLRESLAHGEASPPDLPAAGRLAEVAGLWQAQLHLARRQLPAAEALLERLPSPSELPLSALLAARLAYLRSRVNEVLPAYDEASLRLPDHDGLRLETAEALADLGLIYEAGLRYADVGRMGSRLASAYYALAAFAVYDEKIERGESSFRTAWNLEPIERERLFANPVLAFLAVRPDQVTLLELGSPAEPVVEPRDPGRPLPALTGRATRLLGRRLTAEIGDSEIVVPGGAALAPATVTIEDAATHARRDADRALALLADADDLAAAAPVRSLSYRQLENAAVALGRGHRWDDLLRLTEALGLRTASAAVASPVVAQLRARALFEADRVDEARNLLIRLARDDLAYRRRDPVTFYQLGELMAASGEHELAIRLIERAHQLTPLRMSDARIRQLRMEQRLADSSEHYETAHFEIRYPVSTRETYAHDVGLVLEEEWKRLRKWIPVAADVEIGIDLFPLADFLASYSRGLAVVGLYDGRVRLPFADLQSLHPSLVRILSHELAHAMIAEHTGDRAPKWLHEGLAEHVQMVQDAANPIPDLHAASRVLAFPLIESVLAGFGEPQLVDIAYGEAAWVVHFVEARYGVRGIHRLLDAFAAGGETPAALRRAFGVTPAAFEEAAWEWCLSDAPRAWPTELRRYDREFNPYVRRKPQIAAVDEEQRTPRVHTQPPPPPVPPSAQPMVRWHAAYARRAEPIKAALVPVIRALRSPRPRPADLGASCQRLGELLEELLEDGAVFRSPDGGLIGRQLQYAYQHFSQMSRACRLGRDAGVLRAELEKAEKYLGQAAGRLTPYGLQP